MRKMWVWISVGVAAALAGMFVARSNRRRVEDLGEVSTTWLAEHRADRTS